MLRADGTMRTYGQTYQIGKYVKRDMEDRSRWTVEADIVGPPTRKEKKVTITWHPSRSVYLYLKSHIERFEEKYEHPFYPLQIRSVGYCFGGETGANNCSFIKWNKESHFDDETQSIYAECTFKNRNMLSYKRVNLAHDDILTSQHVHIAVHCPIHDDGMQRSMGSDPDWLERRGYEYMRRFPVSRKWTMDCLVSTDNGVYDHDWDDDTNSWVIKNPKATNEEHKNYHLVKRFLRAEPEEQEQE